MSTDGADSGPARLEATVRGIVQGVGFRYFVLREAMRLGLTGWVANQRDGSVRCVAEGRRSDLDVLAEQLAVGPSGASVEDVELTWGVAVGGHDRFAVRSGSHPGD